MGRDIVQAAKEFEEHAKQGYRPEALARELHNMTETERLAVAKQVSWDMKSQTNFNLPKIEFYDSGDVKSVETSGKSGDLTYTNHVELDKVSGKVRVEVETTNSPQPGGGQRSTLDITERDDRGQLTHTYRSSTELRGVQLKVYHEDDKYSYDSKTGKLTAHDETTSEGRIMHEEYDATTGKQRTADVTSKAGNSHRTYDSTTGELLREEKVNADQSRETLDYDSQGRLKTREKSTKDGTREWQYDPRTGKPVYSEYRAPDGTIKNKADIDANGKWTMR